MRGKFKDWLNMLSHASVKQASLLRRALQGCPKFWELKAPKYYITRNNEKLQCVR
jgi:hypothetical protein